uniref:PLAT domain-containing protein n=1 Tax=Pundamilia nyererei TaxID=303518 RepID=A0A3B4FA82_9CICH
LPVYTVWFTSPVRCALPQVTVKLIGSEAESNVHTLTDPEKPVFERGSVDYFVLTTPFPLGEVQTIRLQHDNSGGTFSRPGHRLVLETNTSGCPSWILPHAARSHVPRGFLAACAFCSVPWPSTSPSGTSLWIQTQQYSFQLVITKS